ncbi:MAG: ABC transporter permease [Clostridia bacterium]|nr:ABC transporter permease [Clostridia bacterium]MBQ8718761.1 ABC transporter permease [Clostridia bacterium]
MNRSVTSVPPPAKRSSSILTKAACAPHTVWTVLFIVAPLLFVCYYAFTTEDGTLTLENITALGEHTDTFILSVCMSVIATVLCLLIGYPLAYCISKCGPRTQKVLIMLLMLPMWMNLLIRTYSMMAILDDGGFLNHILSALGFGELHIVGTAPAVIFGMVYNFLPYMVMPIHSVISKLDKRYIEAASDLGCNGFRTLTRVILPLSASGIISGVTMVFVPSISTFYISQKLGGGTFDMIGDTIERQFQNPSTYNVGAAISLVMMILILISMAVMNRFSDDEGTVIV